MATRKKRTDGEILSDPVQTKNIDARLAALKADLATLQSDMKGLYGDVSEIASERAAQAMKAAEDLAAKAMALAEETASQAGAAARQYRENAGDWAEENAEELRAQVRAQPLTALLVAGGVGAFLGAIFLRR